SELANQLAAHTGISPDLINKGLGAFLSFLKKELGQETYSEVESSVPGAVNSLKTFEESPDPAPERAGLLELTGTWLGSASEERPEKGLSSWRPYPNWGSRRNRSRASCPRPSS